MRKLLCILLCLVLMTPAAMAEGYPLSITAPDSTIRPGKAFLLTFSVPLAGPVDLVLKDHAGETVMDVVLDHPAQAGVNQLWWNGTSGGQSPAEGVYQLALHTGAGDTACAVVIGSHAPYLTSIQTTKNADEKSMIVDFYASVDGMLTVGVWYGDVWALLENRDITAGMNQVMWDANAMQADTYAVTLTLTDATGFSSNEEHVNVSPEEFGIVFATPTPVPTAVPEETGAPTPAITPIVEMAATNTPAITATPTLAPTYTPEPTVTPDPDFAAPLEMAEEHHEDAEHAVPPTATPEAAIQNYTPSHGSVYPLTEKDKGTYWGTVMDITDEEAIWTMLTSPFTYIDASYKGQTKVYAEPDTDSRAVAVVTGSSQGVRVIEERDDGWTLIELYSSTFHDNSIDAWNMLVQGYVRTSKLKTKQMNKKYHIVVDKLTQRLYLFGEGKLITTMLVSTGLSNPEQPYNETRSGDFLFISATGGFNSDNMFCPMGMKFNDGDLLHEVPYIQRSSGSSRIYSATEPYLGTRASHGCIRVQRKRTPEGINMQWIWDNRKDLGRIVVWEDWQGRQVAYPDDELALYYNADGGDYYHRSESCYSADDHIIFTPFAYRELDTGDYADLAFCPYCAPALRRAEIEKINLEHAPGGDHDPVLTQARQKYLDKVVKKYGEEALTDGERRYYTTNEDESEN